MTMDQRFNRGGRNATQFCDSIIHFTQQSMKSMKVAQSWTVPRYCSYKTSPTISLLLPRLTADMRGFC